jgi:hypothetical protein
VAAEQAGRWVSFHTCCPHPCSRMPFLRLGKGSLHNSLFPVQQWKILLSFLWGLLGLYSALGKLSQS